MPSTYTSSLRLTLPQTGDLIGTWGAVVNSGVTSLVDQAIAGSVTVNMGGAATYTLSNTNGTSDEARNMFINVTGTTPGATATVYCPAVSKLYVVSNQVTGSKELLFGVSGQPSVTIPADRRVMLYCNGNFTYVLSSWGLTNQASLIGDITTTVDSNIVAESSTTGAAAVGVASGLTSTAVYQYGATAPASSYGIPDAGLGKLQFYNSTNAMIDVTDATAKLHFALNGALRMSITPAGDVGIATSTPSAKLHVVGNAITTGTLAVGGTGTLTTLGVSGTAAITGDVYLPTAGQQVYVNAVNTATDANRTTFVSNTTDTGTLINIKANGTPASVLNRVAGMRMYHIGDVANAMEGSVEVNQNALVIRAVPQGTYVSTSTTVNLYSFNGSLGAQSLAQLASTGSFILTPSVANAGFRNGNTDVGWTNPSYFNGFTPASGDAFQYRRVANMVEITGAFTNATAQGVATVIAVLPSNYCPTKRVYVAGFATSDSVPLGQVVGFEIDTSGNVLVSLPLVGGNNYTGKFSFTYTTIV